MDKLKEFFADLPHMIQKIRDGEKEVVAYYRAHEHQARSVLEFARHFPLVGPFAASAESAMDLIDRILDSLDGVQPQNELPPSPIQVLA